MRCSIRLMPPSERQSTTTGKSGVSFFLTSSATFHPTPSSPSMGLPNPTINILDFFNSIRASHNSLRSERSHGRAWSVPDGCHHLRGDFDLWFRGDQLHSSMLQSLHCGFCNCIHQSAGEFRIHFAKGAQCRSIDLDQLARFLNAYCGCIDIRIDQSRDAEDLTRVEIANVVFVLVVWVVLCRDDVVICRASRSEERRVG